MTGPLEYDSLDDFPLRWRFAEDATQWSLLPESDLRQLRPLSEACSRDEWRRLVTAEAEHLMAAGDSGPRFEDRLAEYRTSDDWSSKEEATRAVAFLRRHLAVRDETRTLFFWNAPCAAETTWDVLLRYWSDFCYPSDCSNVIVPVEGDRLVVYVEGLVWVAPRTSNSAARRAGPE